MPGLRRPSEMFENFTGDVRWMTANVDHGVYTVVFHPQVIGRGHRLHALEAWLDEIAELGATFARLGDVAGAVGVGAIHRARRVDAQQRELVAAGVPDQRDGPFRRAQPGLDRPALEHLDGTVEVVDGVDR